jgi:Ca2+-binding EF-hand superfamily protein
MFCKPKDDAFQTYKLEKWFDLMDTDSNGKFEVEDTIRWANRSLDNFGLAGGKVTQETRDKLLKECVAFHKKVTVWGMFGNGKESLVKVWKAYTNMPGYETINNSGNIQFLQAFDLNGDGVVDWKEYYYLFSEPYGVSEEDAKKSFEAIDTNHDGVLSFEELSIAMTRYFGDLEVNEYALFYGPIDDFKSE